MEKIHLAICADRNIEIGLHVTLYSAMRHLSGSAETIAHLFLKDFNVKQIQALKLTVQEFGERCKIKIYDAAKVDVGKGKGLHGNKMPYVLFQIPNLVNTARILYLDSDLLNTTDLADLFRLDLKGNPIGVVSRNEIKHCWSKERDFLISVGISENAAYFNTGVVLIDTAEWKRRESTNKCMEFAVSHSKHLFTADQTVLNAVFSEQIKLLPTKYNIALYPTNPILQLDDADGIYHFVGSPKPWDFMGEFLHVSYPAFSKYLLKTFYREYKSFKNLSIPQAVRAIRLCRSYYRTFKSRIKGRTKT